MHAVQVTSKGPAHKHLTGKIIVNPAYDDVGDIDMDESGVPEELRDTTWLFKGGFEPVNITQKDVSGGRILNPGMLGDFKFSARTEDEAEHTVTISADTSGEILAVIEALVEGGVELSNVTLNFTTNKTTQ